MPLMRHEYIWGMYTGGVEKPVQAEKEIDGERYALSGDLLQRRPLAARCENPPLKGGMPKAGGKIDACLTKTLESHEQGSINHPIRQLR